MNYLAHLHIAHHCNSSLLGNLLGDFVKGDPAKRYSRELASGIRLHRFVDSYTDQHALIRQAKSLFPSQQRRFAGIALDMFWDHCLSSQWRHYSESSLDEFIRFSEQQVVDHQHQVMDELLPSNYLAVTSRMWQQNWLASYQHMHVMQRALTNISQRRAKFDLLAECYTTLDEHYAQLTDIFKQLYPQVLAASKEYRE